MRQHIVFGSRIGYALKGTLIQLETLVFLHLVDTHEIRVKDTPQSAAMALSTEVHQLRC
jgi:hypothetical protein